MGFAELHFHLLPGIDDGPKTMEDSLALAAAAVADGTELVVTTPHVRAGYADEPHELPERVAELREHLRRASIPLTVKPGGELSYEMVEVLSDAQLQEIAHGRPGARWVLLESPLSGRHPAFTDAADELRRRGFAIVLAHPERSRPRPDSAGSLQHELDAGTVLQINAWSILGRYGPTVQTLAQALLAGAPTAPIASDAHGTGRPPLLREALAALTQIGDPHVCARALANPWQLLTDGLATAQQRRAA